MTPIQTANPLAQPCIRVIYPNPFTTKTTIRYATQVPAVIDLSVYTLLGQRVATLRRGSVSGVETVTWDGRGDNGELVASGVYLYRLQTPSGPGKTRKLIFLR